MKFYKLSTTLNLKDIGVFPQSQSCIRPWHPNTVFNREDAPIEAFNIPHIKLENKAVQSTIIHAVNISSTRFITLKKHFLDFINTFKKGEFKTWDLEVTHNNKIITDYCLFRLINSTEEEIIDFKKSIFYLGKDSIFSNKREINSYVDLKSYNDYNNLNLLLIEEKTKQSLIPEKLVLDFSKVTTDIIRISNIKSSICGYLVSERFKKTYEEKRFTGVDFKEVETVDKRIEAIY